MPYVPIHLLMSRLFLGLGEWTGNAVLLVLIASSLAAMAIASGVGLAWTVLVQRHRSG